MKKEILKQLIIITASTILGFGLGFCYHELIKETSNTKIKTSQINEQQISITKGSLYTKQLFLDINDPFDKTVVDTIKVLDFKTSKNNPELIYVKWALISWKDTSRYLSTELNIFKKGLKKLN